MMSGRLIYRSGICLILVVALLGFQACSNDDDPVSPPTDQTGAPELPDLSTMTMDLSFFGLAGVDQASVKQGSPSPELLAASTGKDNFINAAVRVLYVHLVFFAAFEPPVAAFALAIHSIPQRQPDGSYLWTYIYVDEGIDYSIFLYGKDEGDYVAWRMEVSTNNPGMPLDHFVWFSGEAQKDDTYGFWQFYEPIDGPPAMAASAGALQTPGEQSIRIDWENQPGNIHSLTILVNKEGAEDEGNTVQFYASPTVHYIEFTDYTTNPSGDVYDITWYADGSGSLLVPDYPPVNPGTKACWDTQQYDIVCPD
ncbi:MAG: hypothetical protein JSW58_17155 [Candidatus Latescibacterota bacterium]|nr:MAG: hypothetical protein JSW58_17155 [Candidatus Latescibacterota bacterium]